MRDEDFSTPLGTTHSPSYGWPASKPQHESASEGGSRSSMSKRAALSTLGGRAGCREAWLLAWQAPYLYRQTDSTKEKEKTQIST